MEWNQGKVFDAYNFFLLFKYCSEFEERYNIFLTTNSSWHHFSCVVFFFFDYKLYHLTRDAQKNMKLSFFSGLIALDRRSLRYSWKWKKNEISSSIVMIDRSTLTQNYIRVTEVITVYVQCKKKFESLKYNFEDFLCSYLCVKFNMPIELGLG